MRESYNISVWGGWFFKKARDGKHDRGVLNDGWFRDLLYSERGRKTPPSSPLVDTGLVHHSVGANFPLAATKFVGGQKCNTPKMLCSKGQKRLNWPGDNIGLDPGPVTAPAPGCPFPHAYSIRPCQTVARGLYSKTSVLHFVDKQQCRCFPSFSWIFKMVEFGPLKCS